MSATINGNVLNITGSGGKMAIRVRSSGDTTLTVEGSVIANQTKFYKSETDGDFSFSSAPGIFLVRFGEDGPEIGIQVPDDDSEYEFEDLITDAVVYAGDAPNVQAVVGYSLAGLRALERHISNQIADMLYFSSVGDGGAGRFYYDTASTDTDDNGLTTVKPTDKSVSDPGRWKRFL